MRYSVETETGLKIMSRSKLWRYFISHDTERVYGSHFIDWLFDMERMGLVKRRPYER